MKYLIAFMLLFFIYGCGKEETINVEYRIYTPSRAYYTAKYNIGVNQRRDSFIGDTIISYKTNEGVPIYMEIQNVINMNLELWVDDRLIESDQAIRGSKEYVAVSY